MKKERQLEKIQLEYDLYDGIEVSSVSKAARMIFSYLEEVDVARSFIDLEKKRNSRKRFISNLLGKYAEKFGYLDSWYYDMDDAYLDKKSEALNTYYNQLNSFWGTVNDKNYVEIFRLMSFTRHKCREYRVGIQEERDCIRKSATGEAFERPVVFDESTVYAEWFEGALENARCIQNVEKVKK